MHRKLALSALAFFALMLSGSQALAMSGGGVPICSALRDQTAPVLVADTLGGAFVGWIDARTGYNLDLYVRRIDAHGAPAAGWTANGNALTTITCLKFDLAMVADGRGGALAAWGDDRCTPATGVDLYVSRIGVTGARPAGWPNNGVAVCVMNGEQRYPAIAPDGTGGAIVAWADLRSGLRQLYAARVRANGTLDPAWPANGLLVASAVADSAHPAMLSDGAGGVYVAWEDRRAGGLDLYAQRLDSTGTVHAGWPAQGVEVCGAAGDQWQPRVVSDAAGGVFVAWQDRRSGLAQICAQRLTAGGGIASGWPAGGHVLAGSPGAQSGLAFIADGAGGAVAAWQETRSPALDNDLYATRVNSAGSIASGWQASGNIVCAASGEQSDVAVRLDPNGQLVFAWMDARDAATNGIDLRAQRLTLSGNGCGGWPGDGLALCTAAGDQRSVALVANGPDGALAAWSDARNMVSTGYDIACALVTPTGMANLQVRGLSARHHDGQTFLTWSCAPGAGWTSRIYRSASPIGSSADLTGATLVATVGDSTAYDRRYSLSSGTNVGFRVDTLSAELDPAQGLLAITTPAQRTSYYAVTAENLGFGEDRSVLAGQNALAAPVVESVGLPRPVLQRYYPHPTIRIGVYTLFASMTDTPLFPAMANRPDMKFDCLLTPGQTGPPGSETGTSLMLVLHWRGASFYNCPFGSYRYGEWVLSLDDGLPNGQSTFWYGYHPDYDIASPPGTIAPTTGSVVDYTMRRVRFSTDWALRNNPIDSTRVYAFGYSLGGIGATMIGFHMPERIAAAMSVVGKFDFSYLGDPSPLAWFNTGGSFRKLTDVMWGKIATNLPSTDGMSVYHSLDEAWLAAQPDIHTLPPVFTFSGKHDSIMGWAEKPEFFEAMNQHRRGGAYYWDTRDHASSFTPTWLPEQDLRFMYRFRSDLSFPALSNCSIDSDPGNGLATDGDPVGSINGHVDWDTLIVDHPTQWKTLLKLRNLEQAGGVVLHAPDSCAVDVTPARLQHFARSPGSAVEYKVFRHATNALVQSGTVLVDSLGRVTIPGVRVYREGSDLVIGDESWLGAPPAPPARTLELLVERNPVHARAALVVHWPAGANGRIDLLDVGGRRIRTFFAGPLLERTSRLSADVSSLPGGVYFAQARCGGHTTTRRIVVLP